MFDKLHARKTGPTCSKKKNRIECPFKREDQLAQRKRIYSNVLLKGYIVGPLTLHQKGVFFGSQNSCHILVGKSTLSISNLKWSKTQRENRTGSVFEKKIPSEMELAPRYNCWHWWVIISYMFVLFQFSNGKEQLRAEMPFGKWLSYGCLGVFSNWLSKKASKSIF